MKLFEAPEMEVVKIAVEDIITTSDVVEEEDPPLFGDTCF